MRSVTRQQICVCSANCANALALRVGMEDQSRPVGPLISSVGVMYGVRLASNGYLRRAVPTGMRCSFCQRRNASKSVPLCMAYAARALASSSISFSVLGAPLSVVAQCVVVAEWRGSRPAARMAGSVLSSTAQHSSHSSTNGPSTPFLRVCRWFSPEGSVTLTSLMSLRPKSFMVLLERRATARANFLPLPGVESACLAQLVVLTAQPNRAGRGSDHVVVTQRAVLFEVGGHAVRKVHLAVGTRGEAAPGVVVDSRCALRKLVCLHVVLTRKSLILLIGILCPCACARTVWMVVFWLLVAEIWFR